MPSDANGVHSLPNGYLAKEGETIQPSQHNPPLEDLSNGLSERMMRSGVTPMTGPLKLTDGTSAAPGLAFNSDPTAGFYLSGGAIFPTKPLGGVFLTGMMIPWPLLTIPPNWVSVIGQTLSRTGNPKLWTVAQAEITAGNPMFNNGDGFTTFGILDMRGCAWIGHDNGAGRVTTTFGVGLGQQSVSLLRAHIPPHMHSGVTGGMNQNNPHSHGTNAYQATSGTGAFTANPGIIFTAGAVFPQDINHGHPFTTDNGDGLFGNSHPNVQPSVPGNWIMYTGNANV